MGAKVIRAYEKEHGVNVPWTVILHLEQSTPTPLDLASLVTQGQALGIYTYFVYIGTQTANPDALLTVMNVIVVVRAYNSTQRLPCQPQIDNVPYLCYNAQNRTNGWMSMKPQNSPRRVVLRDIADVTGYTVNTVSRALQNKPDIARATCAHIQTVARQMGYIRNSLAGSLRSGSSRTLAAVVGDVSNPFYATMASTP